MLKRVNYFAVVLVVILACCHAKSVIPELTYSFVDKDTYDAPVKTQVEYHVVVSGTITEFNLNELLQVLYDEAKSTRGFKYHAGKPTHIFIYLYLSEDHFKSGMGQWIAMLSKIGDNSQVETKIKTEMIAQLDSKPETKQGLSESIRKEIFKAVFKAEDRAYAESESMYPIPDPLDPGYSSTKVKEQMKKQSEICRTLIEKYKLELEGKYSINREQFESITEEGFSKNWPIPPLD